jgi:hypothetical protein
VNEPDWDSREQDFPTAPRARHGDQAAAIPGASWVLAAASVLPIVFALALALAAFAIKTNCTNERSVITPTLRCNRVDTGIRFGLVSQLVAWVVAAIAAWRCRRTTWAPYLLVLLEFVAFAGALRFASSY